MKKMLLVGALTALSTHAREITCRGQLQVTQCSARTVQLTLSAAEGRFDLKITERYHPRVCWMILGQDEIHQGKIVRLFGRESILQDDSGESIGRLEYDLSTPGRVATLTTRENTYPLACE